MFGLARINTVAGLGYTLGAAYAIQAAVALPSILFQSDRFYDLSGSLTYLTCIGLSLYFPQARGGSSAYLNPWTSWTSGGLHARQALLSAFAAIWATRLGTFLFQRVVKTGGDSRFEEIRKSPIKFAGAFFAQATWVNLVALPVFACNAIRVESQPRLNWIDKMGMGLWAFGFLFEIIADHQKSTWSAEKKAKKHEEDFLTRGLWSVCRHPNYFGEITLWTGIALLAARGVVQGPWGVTKGLAMCAISPIFTAFLLTKASGIPLSEKKYDKKFGHRKDYQEWKKNTPLLLPKVL
ncbi:hypothetical protein DFS34DRAFT_718848 [Phlyctochytrium arcticum]|nr:hypothetical protein DFS34DRAFT_718848 [Phlyctochytrium arcticum]